MKISIITPSLNQASFLKETMHGVLSQEGDFDLEWIVIDGGSTDGTLDLLKSIHDPRVTWISEKDRGQSHAINKGIARSTGEIIGWLNSDDLYAPGALGRVAEAFTGASVDTKGSDPFSGWLVGRCDIINAGGNEIRRSITRYKNRRLARYTRKRLLLENFISQPAVFFHRSLIDRVGPLDESLRICMDYDLWLRLSQVGEPILLEHTLARFRIHANSITGSINRARFEEDYQVARRYLPNTWMCIRKRLAMEKIVWAYHLLNLFGRNTHH